MSATPRKPKYHVLDNGYTIPYLFEKEFEKSCTYEPEPGDVFICTYPKCGTTWAQNMLYLMLHGGRPLTPGQNINNFIPHLEDQGREFVEKLSKPRVIKTHLPYSMLPKSREAKYIFVARNPKDCCVSFFYHTKGFARCYHYADGTFDDYFKLFLDGEVDYGDYFDYLLAYVSHKDDPNMLFLLYEEMKEDIEGCIRKIGRFLGGQFLRACEDPTILEAVVQNCSFTVMKSTPSLWSTAQVQGSPGFIRKGEVGDWRNHFSEEQAKQMDEKFTSKLAGTEAEHLWDKYDC